MTTENMLEKTGLHFDDLNKICVLEPEIAQQTTNLKDECQEFISKISELQNLVNKFTNTTSELAKEVEKEKMKAIGSRNLLKSIAKERETQKQQLLVLIGEKKTELERLRMEHASLQKQEQEQNEFIDQFSSS